MKATEITELFERFEAAASEYEGVECWSARDLQHLLGYSKWENFSKVIDKAKEASHNAGIDTGDHFPDVRKVIEAGKGAQHEIGDILLTRYPAIRWFRRAIAAKCKYHLPKTILQYRPVVQS